MNGVGRWEALGFGGGARTEKGHSGEELVWGSFF